MIKRRKGASLVAENVIFIILNLVFLTILLLFLYSKMGSAAVLEESYAKQIALMIDASKPRMRINLNMEDAFEKKEKGFEEDIVRIHDNFVIVKLREKGGYTYSFFNDVEVEAYPGKDSEKEYYIITINEK